MPQEQLHGLFIIGNPDRHYKNEFRLTKKGEQFSNDKGKLFLILAEWFLFEYMRTKPDTP